MSGRKAEMKTVNFTYDRVGHIIMLDESDWQKAIKWLSEHGVRVQEKAQANKRVKPTSAIKRVGKTKAQ